MNYKEYDKYDKHHRYRGLLRTMYYLGMISNKQYLQIYNECFDKLDEI